MVFKPNNPGCSDPDCSCDEVCLLDGDQFAANGDGPGDALEEVSGDWERDGGFLIPPADGLVRTTFDHSTPSMIASVDVWATDPRTQLSAVVALTDAADLLYGEVDFANNDPFNNAVLRLMAGDVELASKTFTAEFSHTYRLRVCYTAPDGGCDPTGRLTAVVEAEAGVGATLAVVTELVDATGLRAGLKTGEIAGDARFDNFTWSRLNDECPGCALECLACTDEAAAALYSVRLTGIEPDDTPVLPADCCNEINGTYILRNAGPCTWEWQDPDEPCLVQLIQLEIYNTGTPLIGFRVTVTLLNADPRNILEYNGSIAGVDCKQLDDLELADVGTFGAEFCRLAGSAKAFLTAL